MQHFRSDPDVCIVDEDLIAPLDEAGEWEYSMLLDPTERLADGTPICAQMSQAGLRAACRRLGVQPLTPADLELLHDLSRRGLCIELPAFTGTPTAETSLAQRKLSDEANRKALRAAGHRPGVRWCNFGKGWVELDGTEGVPDDKPGERATLMGWWVPSVGKYGITTRSGPGFIQPRPTPGRGAHGLDAQADDGTNCWVKWRRVGGVGRKVSAFGQAIVAGAREIASALGGHVLPAPSPSNQGGHVLPKEPPVSTRSTIRRGSTGPLVSLWQAFLRVPVTGAFSIITETATKEWQKACGLVADGVVGTGSWAAFGADQANLIEPTAAPTAGLDAIPLVLAKNFRVANRPASSVRLIVLHTMEAAEKPETAENVAKWFAGAGAPMASAHFCVDNDSTVQCVPLKDVAFAAPGANNDGIQIEMAARASQSAAEWDDEYSRAMLGRVAALMGQLSELYDIPLEYVDVKGLLAGKRGVTTHFDVSKAFKKSTHQDPGPGFPMQMVLAMAVAALSAT